MNILSLGNTAHAFKQMYFLWLMFVAYIIAFLASLLGNSVIIHIIRKDNSMKTTTNYLILNQACTDLVITMAEIMTAIHYSFMDKIWLGGLFGLITCKMFQAILFTAPAFSTWILAAIAVDRFYAVTRPFRLSPLSQNLKKIILVLWAWSFALTITFVIGSESFKQIHHSVYCTATNEWTLTHFLAFTLDVFLPLIMTVVLYTIVCLKLWSREVPGEGPNQNEQQVEAIKIARKVTIMMVVVVAFYVVCWFPMFISILLNYVYHVELGNSFSLFFVWLTLFYSGFNPYIYLVFSQNFRNGFKSTFRRFLIKINVSDVISFRSQSVELEQI